MIEENVQGEGSKVPLRCFFLADPCLCLASGYQKFGLEVSRAPARSIPEADHIYIYII